MSEHERERGRTLGADELRLVCGGVEVHAASSRKDPWPALPPRDPSFPGNDAEWAAYWEEQQVRGSGAPRAVPVLRVVRIEG